MKNRRLFFLVVLLIAALPALPTGAQTLLRVAIPGGLTGALPIYLDAKKGVFSKYGLTVEVIATRNEQDTILVEVSDSGMGMEPGTLQKIFDPFEQGNSEITNLYGGLGLGLSIARGLVELLGGTISAQSDGVGKGSTFTVRLPLSLS